MALLDEHRHPLVPQDSASEAGVTYAEVRDWAWWLQLFTVDDLADSMMCDRSIAQRGINALLWHGICFDTGEEIDGDPVISYVPLPPGPREHPTRAPEWRTCVQDLVPPDRGKPVRLVDNTKRRDAMQGTGGARVRIRQRDKAYEAMEAAKQTRRERQAKKRQDELQGRINRQKGKTKTHAVDRNGKVGEQ